MKLMQIMKLCCLAIFFLACHDQRQTDMGNPVSGKLTILSDETYLPLVKVLASAFEAAYPMTVIEIDTVVSENPLEKLAKNKIRSLITSIPPGEKDLLALNQRNIFPSSFHFATDAVSLVSRKDSSVKGTIVFHISPSGCLEIPGNKKLKRFITGPSQCENNLFLKLKLSPGCINKWYSLSNQMTILQRVAENGSETGIISWSYLCEKESPEVVNWKTKLDIIPFESASSQLIYPTQSAIASGDYPLSRKLYLLTAEPFAGPATGFAAFVASDEGQRIIRLFGLAPSKTPPRELIIN